jgi:hypothetical protein
MYQRLLKTALASAVVFLATGVEAQEEELRQVWGGLLGAQTL